MNKLLCAVVIIAVFGTVAFAYPSLDTESSAVEMEDALWVRIPKTFIIKSEMEIENQDELQPLRRSRSRRSPEDEKTKIYAGGSHDPRHGSNIYVQGQQRVWQSQDRKNEIHANGHYGQHFGGPGGRSPPSYGGGLTYTRRF